MLESFTPLQLDIFHALSNFYPLPSDAAYSLPPRKSKRGMSRRKPLQLYPIGTKASETVSMDAKKVWMEEQVFDYCASF